MMKEFRAFVLRGNVVDMAVGVIIGGAFGKIVSSLINDIIMPPLGKLLGNVDFRELFVPLDGHAYKSLEEAVRAGAPLIKYGLFINTVVDFLVVAAVIFFTIHKLAAYTAVKEEAPSVKTCPECASEVPTAARKCKFCGSQV